MEFDLPFPKCNVETSASFFRWEALKQRFHCHCKQKKQKESENLHEVPSHSSLLLHLGGEDAYKIVKNYLSCQKHDIGNESLKNTINKLLCNIENQCMPLFILLYERFKFFTYHQNEADNIVKYIMGLTNLASYSELCEKADMLLLSQLKSGVWNEDLRGQINQQKPKNLKEMIAICLKFNNLKHRMFFEEAKKKRGRKMKVENTVKVIAEMCGINTISSVNNDSLQTVLRKEVKLKPNVEVEKDKNVCTEGFIIKSLPSSPCVLEQKIESRPTRRKANNLLQSSSQAKTKARRTTKKSSNRSTMSENKRCVATTLEKGIAGDTHKDNLISVVDTEAALSTRTEDWKQDTGNVTLTYVSEEEVLTEIVDDKHELRNENVNSKSAFLRKQKSIKVENKKQKLKYKRQKKCSICKTVFLSTYLLNLHKRTHFDQQQYKCDICNVDFLHSGTRSRHMRHAHPQLLKFKCEMCDMLFDLQTALDQHRLTHSKNIHCAQCGQTFMRSREYYQHRKKEHKNFCYTCDKCGLNFPFPSKLKLHLMSKHNATKPYMCEICGSSFAEHNMLVNHKNIHLGNKKYECITCGRRFVLKSSLNNHIPTHLDEKPHVCMICGMGFKLLNYLTSHMKIHSNSRVRRHVCSTCGAAFLKASQLKNHERKHTGEKPYKCDICGTVFSQLSSMKKHVKYMHEGIKPKDRFSCEYCGLSFTFSCKLKLHLMKHTGERPFSCSICNSTYREKHQLMYHMKTHNGQEPHKCPICDRRFLQKSYLEGHMRKHTGEKPFVCSVCNACFTHKGYLRDHSKVHNQNRERKYKCGVCGKAFTCSSHMRSHERLHSGVKPHICPICGSKFTKRSSVKKHLRRTHGIQNILEDNNQALLSHDGISLMQVQPKEHPHNENVQVLHQDLHSPSQLHSHPHHEMPATVSVTHFTSQTRFDMQSALRTQVLDVSDAMVTELQPQLEQLHTLHPAVHTQMHQHASAHPGLHPDLQSQLPPHMLSDIHMNLETSNPHSQLVTDIHIYTLSS